MKNKKTILILIPALAILGGIFVYVLKSSGGSVDSMLSLTPVENASETGQLLMNEDQSDVINMLATLNKVKLNVDFFNSGNFLGLIDYSISLPVAEKGRTNPFSPYSAAPSGKISAGGTGDIGNEE